eukprot:CAMPEP_0119043348 /NCGR_PEP_ID=MMETSP1177-20130426/21100_1 /TAXON_ID=2985 /ORGANISM="Ochromonas sp, Strain CCMP1899" /LENGTH=613 /DNA_ID=CAMNT_0007011263 /DNA_START=127 /DNA_END=1965 /DNA_ORIENTATION=-
MQMSFYLLLLSIAPITSLKQFKATAVRSCNAKIGIRLWSSLGSSEKVSDEKTLRFLDWAEKQGIKAEKCDISKFPGGLRGIKATEDHSDDYISVSVPAEFVIETNNNRPPSPFVDFCSEQFWSTQCKWDHRLALKLIYEVKGFAQVSSNKREWLEKLPESFNTPFHWSKDDLAKVQYTALEQKVENQKLDWKKFYNEWVTDTGKSLQVENVSFDEFVWALENVNSRAFSGVYEGSTAGERRALFLFTGALTLIWPLAGLGTTEQSLGAAFLVAVSIITKDFFFSRAAGLKRYVICPYIDMFNHKSTCNSDVSYGYFSDSFELKTEGYKKGEQVFISYGKQSNDRLLQYYGFTDPGNPFDIYDFGIGFLELILKYADAISEDTGINISANPSPQERLQQIASAIQSTVVEDSTASALQKSSSSAGNDKNTRYFRKSPQKVDEKKVTKDELPDTADSNIISHFDDITVRSIRALYSSAEEWNLLVKQSGDSGTLQNLNRLGVPLSSTTEQNIASVMYSLIQLELQEKSTTLEEDVGLLGALENLQRVGSQSKKLEIETKKVVEPNKKGFGDEKPTKNSKTKTSPQKEMKVDPSGYYRDQDFAALTFRIEKKRILK